MDDPSTIISPRTYLQDAAFLVALQAEPEVITRCADALISPFWPVFLGRKACVPTRPVFDGVTDVYVSLEDVMRHHPWNWDAGRCTREPRPQRLKCIIEDPTGNFTRYDRLRVNPARMYGWRRANVLWVDFPGSVDEAREVVQ